MTPRGLVAAALALLAVSSGSGGCNGSEAPDAGAYQRELEAIEQSSLTPAVIGARDALVNILQGGSVAAARGDLRRVSGQLGEAASALRDLKPPPEKSTAHTDLIALVDDFEKFIAGLRAEDLRRAAAAQVEEVERYDGAIRRELESAR